MFGRYKYVINNNPLYIIMYTFIIILPKVAKTNADGR